MFMQPLGAELQLFLDGWPFKAAQKDNVYSIQLEGIMILQSAAQVRSMLVQPGVLDLMTEKPELFVIG